MRRLWQGSVSPELSLDWGNEDVAAGKVVLYKPCDWAAFHKSGEDLHRQAQVGGGTPNIGFCTGGLHLEQITAVDRLSADRCDPDPHAGGNDHGVFCISL